MNRDSASRPARFEPSGPLRGELRVPGDKSISHRAALLGAMGDGRTVISGFLDAADTRSSLGAVEALGASIRDADSDRSLNPCEGRIPERIAIEGVGMRGPRPAEVDVGNAGTLIRLLPGWLAGQAVTGRWSLDGDASIRHRPMARIAEPLRRMGAEIRCAEGDRAPIEVEGRALTGITYELPVASAQVKSCILIAGLLAEGKTTLIEPEPSRDHTERMLAASGAGIVARDGSVTIEPAERIEPPEHLVVPGDISSAAFPIVAAILVPGSEIRLAGVGVNPTRTGILDVLIRMGADIEIVSEHEDGGEPVASLRVRSADLSGTTVEGAEVPRAIDELPILALAAACAEGSTVIRDATELRRKESDRVETVAAGLRSLGARVESEPDGWVIEGAGSAEGLQGGVVDSAGDHRIAMLGAVAGIAVPGGVEVRGMEAAEVSYRGFQSDLASLL